MNKLILLFLIILFLLTLIFYKNFNHKPNVLINDHIFYVDVAKTDEEKTKGLAIYENLAKDHGMLFPFEKKDFYAFWMKDMNFPIDIIYIQNNRIVDIFQNVPPPTQNQQELPIYRPKEKSNYVLEINAGLSKKYKFKIGENLKINL